MRLDFLKLNFIAQKIKGLDISDITGEKVIE